MGGRADEISVTIPPARSLLYRTNSEAAEAKSTSLASADLFRSFSANRVPLKRAAGHVQEPPNLVAESLSFLCARAGDTR